jgi:hypothetical protein
MTAAQEASIQWSGVDGIERKVVFEPYGNGEHFRAEYEKFGEWRLIGREPVEDVEFEVNEAEIVSTYRVP